jgi:hypothetical protein
MSTTATQPATVAPAQIADKIAHFAAKDELLREISAQVAALREEMATAKDAALTDEVRERLRVIEDSYSPVFASLEERAKGLQSEMDALKAEISQDVVSVGETVRSAGFAVIYTAGRTSWDSKKLEGMMAFIPQIAEARKIGDPSVSWRKA